jgi:drug/metabolite transporter (DMT)-like permease
MVPSLKPPGTRPTDLALLLVLATAWGAAYSFIKVGVETIPPVTLIAARTVIAGGLLLAVMRLRGVGFPREPALWRAFMVQACLNSVVPFTLIAWAEQTVEAGLAVILNATTPIFAFLFTVAVTRHEAVTGRKLLGVILGIGGTCLIVGTEALGGLGRDLLAQIAVVGASAFYAAAAIFGRRFHGVDPMATAAGSMLCGAALLVPASLVVDRPWALSPSTASLLALVALAAFSTALAFVIYFRLLHTLGAVGTTAQASWRVPIGVALGVVFLGVTLMPTAWAGLVLVVAGVVAMTLPGRRSAPREEAPERRSAPREEMIIPGEPGRAALDER